MTRLMLVSLALGLAVGGSTTRADAPDFVRIAKILRSGDRAARFEAFREVENLKAIPEDLVEPVVAFTRAELEYALLPSPAGPSPGSDTAVTTGPLGDEISLPRLQADPRKFVGKTFVLLGVLRIADVYAGGYREARASHYAFALRPSGREVQAEGGPTVLIYIDRRFGAALAEAVTEAQERGDSGRPIRLRCTIPSERCKDDEGDAVDSIEVSDWQYPTPRGDGWTPWAFDGVRSGFEWLRRAGAVAAPALVRIVVDEQEFQNASADVLQREMAIQAITGMDEEGRNRAYARLQRSAPRIKSPKAHAWASRAAKALRARRR